MSRIKLTLSCPLIVAEQVTEALLESDWVTDGFAALDASGHGADFSDATLRERVRGRIDTQLLTVLLPAANVAPLLQELRNRFRSAQMHYWTEAVLDSGDFT